jgi:hypothetical protein
MGYAEDAWVCRFEGLAAAGFGKLGGKGGKPPEMDVNA